MSDLSGTVIVLTPPWDGVGDVQEALLRRGAAGSISLIPSEAFYQRLRIVRGPTRYHLPDRVDSLIFHLPTDAMLAHSLRLQGAAAVVVAPGQGRLFRVPVGTEDPEDLCRDLGGAVEEAP